MTALQLVSEKSVLRIWSLKPDLWIGNNSWSGYFLSLNKLKCSLELGVKNPKRPFCKSPLKVSTAANTSGVIACSYSGNSCSLQPSGPRNSWALWGRACGRSCCSREPGRAGTGSSWCQAFPQHPLPARAPCSLPCLPHPHRHLCQGLFLLRSSPRRFWWKELSEEIV